MQLFRPPVNDNKRLVTSRLLVVNRDFEDLSRTKHWVVDFKTVDPWDVITWAMQYLKLMQTSLTKLIVYCNPSFLEESQNEDGSPYTLVDMQFVIRYVPDAKAQTSGANWELVINVPKTHLDLRLSSNGNNKNNNKTNEDKRAQAFTYVYLISSVSKLLSIIKKNGKQVTQVELHTKGVKVSDNKEMMTLYYNP